MSLLFAPFYPHGWAHYSITSGFIWTSGISQISQASLDFLLFSWILFYSHKRTLLSSAQRAIVSYVRVQILILIFRKRNLIFICFARQTLMFQAPLIDLYLLCSASEPICLLCSTRLTLISYVSQWGPICFSYSGSWILISYALQADSYVLWGEPLCFSFSTRWTILFSWFARWIPSQLHLLCWFSLAI